MTNSKWLDVLSHCADLTDDISSYYFNNKDVVINEKTNQTPVTQADLECESKIRDYLKNNHPELDVYGEEHGTCDVDAPLKFIIDPIDGTRNFIDGLPFFASLMAVEENGEIVAGMVSCPMHKDRWWASKHNGSFYNGQQINVSETKTLDQAQAMHGSLSGQEANGAPQRFLDLLKKQGVNVVLEIIIFICLLPWVLVTLQLILTLTLGILRQWLLF